LDDPSRLEQALEAHHVSLRARLHGVLSRPEIREALFVASPDLDSSFDVWVREPESQKGQKVERALTRYFLRMAGRATPFGLFAGVSVGMVGDETRLTIEQRSQYQRHTRLDMDYLFALVEALGRDPELRPVLVYHPNSSLYTAGGRLRYAESRLDGEARSYHLVAVEATDYLEATLTRARDGATQGALAEALVEEDISLEEAEAYIGELIASQILVPAIPLPVTGPEPVHPLIEHLAEQPETQAAAERLGRVRTELAAIDAEGLGSAPSRYRAVAQLLEALPARVELPRLFQVDMVKPAPHAALGSAVVAEIVRGVEILHRLARPPRQDTLGRFQEAFVTRYEEREVPLLEALDEEVGIGLKPSDAPDADASPLLKGLAFPTAPEETAPWGERERVLLGKLAEVLAQGSWQMELTHEDLDAMAVADAPPLPDAFAVMATVAAASEDALAQGDFQVVLEGASGPSGVRLLGRFCHAGPALQEQVERHLRAEEAHHPDAIHAEIVHLPEGRVGNVLCRPLLREYEVPYLGISGAPAERQIPVSDLLVSVRNGRVVLRSARWGKEVIPRLSTAHNFTWRSLGVYRFLCLLQEQGVVGGVGWDWGVLASAPFVPRVTMGRLVLSRACWRLGKEDIQQLTERQGIERFQAAQTWRTERRLPRWVVLADGDNTLPVDLDNVLSVETFAHLVKGRDEAVVTELFPGPEQLCAYGPEGRFAHELVVPFVRAAQEPAPQADASEVASSGRAGLVPSAVSPPGRVVRVFPPGSEWLYAKLYTGPSTADRVLREVVRPLTQEALSSGAADGWFFIRYADPDPHLRLRLHGVPEKLHRYVLPGLQACLVPLIENGRVSRLQLETYEREVERYGGPEGIALAERLFHIDSEAVLDLVERLEPGDEGLDERWRLALRGTDMLLCGLGFGLERKRSLMEHAREGQAQSLRADTTLARRLGDKFRQERRGLEGLLDPAQDEASPLGPGLAVLHRRAEQSAPVVAELRALEAAGRLSVPLAGVAASYVHMFINRLLRSAQNAQECVLYDFLVRLYRSQAARVRRQSRNSS
jgi:thiopeptide-type bacteriocin biosynthesis protein